MLYHTAAEHRLMGGQRPIFGSHDTQMCAREHHSRELGSISNFTATRTFVGSSTPTFLGSSTPVAAVALRSRACEVRMSTSPPRRRTTPIPDTALADDDRRELPLHTHGSSRTGVLAFLSRGGTPLVLALATALLLLSVTALQSFNWGVGVTGSEKGLGVGLPVSIREDGAVLGGPRLGLTPISAASRPHYDLLVAVLVVGGVSQEAQDEIARVRRVYARYGSEVIPDGGSVRPLSLKVVFVVGRAGLPEGMVLPESGILLGDFFHVDVREGYTHLSDKTKAMMALSEHISFRFLVKTDGDTFPCLSRVTQQLVDLPLEDQPRVYAGLLATCGKVFPKGHKLHDPEFLKATGGVLDCHPMYHQGAFYVLGERIVQHLQRSRDMLTLMSVEDAMVGMWLLAIDKVILDIGGHFYCQCFTHPVPARKLSFYHFCKTEEKIDGCLQKFGAC